MTEDDLELTCLDWFADVGWQVIYGPELSPESNQIRARDSYHDVLLIDDLQAAAKRINAHIPADAFEACFEQALRQLRQQVSMDLASRNRNIHQLFLAGIAIQYKDADDRQQQDRLFVIDFETVNNNQFTAINQLTIKTGKEGRPRRPDIICYVNGLPLAVIELKSPSDETVDITDAFNQLQTYKTELPDLFIYNEALIISDGYSAKVGSLTANEEWFMPWRTIANEDDKPMLEWQLETVIKGFFRRDLFIDYIRYFVLFEEEGGQLIKKQAAYHQFHAVREAVKATVIASKNLSAENVDSVAEPRATYGSEVESGSKKAGVVWHTQGSGKSISMCCYASKLSQHPKMGNPTIVVVTDRNDLDGQLFATFSSAYELLRQTPLRAEDRDSLRARLSERESGGIIFTTVQKFALLADEEAHPVLNERHNLVVISDEAHRSQYGLNARYNQKTGQYQHGYAKYLRDALPNATFIGFTGTPIATEDKDTRAVFGDYVSIYDIQDAVDDGATVPIFYESRLAKLDLNHTEISALSDEVEEIIEEDEDSSREKTKGEWTRLEKLVGSQPRLELVASDLVEHFEQRLTEIDGKAMVVGMSRDICVQLYNEIVALRPEWHDEDPTKGVIKIVMTGSASDKPLLQPHIYSNKTKKMLETRFKDPSDALKLVIVRDMWLTGFDAPSCHTMYIDKPMRGHNLMQAIARVNRVFKDKPGGLVVDYIGIANELKEALKIYTESKGRGQPTYNAAEALQVFLARMDAIQGMFAKTAQHEGLDISDFEIQTARLLPIAANHILGLDDGKKRFADLVLQASKAYALCSTLDTAKPYQQQLAFFTAIKSALTKFERSQQSNHNHQKSSALKRIVDNAVVAEGVDDIFKLCGLDKPNIGLLSDDFLDDVRQMPEQNLAVELLQKLLKDDIHAKTQRNVLQEKKFSERLQATLTRYNNRSIETAQVIEELIAMAKSFQEEMARFDESGLNTDEIAFYDALANNESAVRQLGDETLKKIAIEITDRLRKSTTVDWQKRESVRSKLRILVRRTLQKWKYPPDKAAEAVVLVMQQAEVLADGWSQSS
ncbi:type I restriction endonuclease subunit R [Psychrobacter alimentarius]|uniref:type I restriction endonuclease subunit R n=1 Tax=Psychrobacter alimentarius TaxID=261164 RepID=UPI00191A7B0E|nr:type I restriction endonuclease subunit R [Psychrobacter alimentarius]